MAVDDLPKMPTQSGGQALADAEAPCRLLSLPAELRNRIYHLAFGQNVFEEHIKLFARPQELLDSASLLRTCKQIYEETRGIYTRAREEFYSENKFEIDGTQDSSGGCVTQSFNKPSAKALAHIQHLQIRTLYSKLYHYDDDMSWIFAGQLYHAEIVLTRRASGVWHFELPIGLLTGVDEYFVDVSEGEIRFGADEPGATGARKPVTKGELSVFLRDLN